jgi:hypothetical protein
MGTTELINNYFCDSWDDLIQENNPVCPHWLHRFRINNPIVDNKVDWVYDGKVGYYGYIKEGRVALDGRAVIGLIF